LAVKYKEALSWYPHNIEKPDAVTSCSQKCHYEGNLLDASVMSVNQIDSEIPSAFELSKNYPNPFNPGTTIKFSIPQTSFISIVVYDLLGKSVTKLAHEEMNPGTYSVSRDGKDQFGKETASGVYYVV
jgi:hypothetical protein